METRQGLVSGDRLGRESEASTDSPETEREIPEGRVLPLNSKRLTSVQLRAIARALELPARGSREDIRLTIEGKLRENYDELSVRVVVQEISETETKLFLIDENGMFLEVEVGQKEGNAPVELEAKNIELTRQNEELTAVLQEAHQKLADQQAELNHLTEALERAMRETEDPSGVSELEELGKQLKREKENAKRLWRLNCKRAAEREELLSAKELEIEELKRQLEDHDSP